MVRPWDWEGMYYMCSIISLGINITGNLQNFPEISKTVSVCKELDSNSLVCVLYQGVITPWLYQGVGPVVYVELLSSS